MVGYAGSPTRTVYVTQSKVKVTGLLSFRQLAKPCMLVAMIAAPLRGFLVLHVEQPKWHFIFVAQIDLDNTNQNNFEVGLNHDCLFEFCESLC